MPFVGRAGEAFDDDAVMLVLRLGRDVGEVILHVTGGPPDVQAVGFAPAGRPACGGGAAADTIGAVQEAPRR